MNVFCSTSLSKADSGNGTYTVMRMVACPNPGEDIEAYARNEFTARAHLDDDNNVSCAGHLKINGGQCTLLCESSGGVTLSNEELEEGHTSGTIEVEIWGVTVSLQWAMSGGDDLEQTFSHNDTGTGGRTPEVFTCHTDLNMDVNISDSNGYAEEGDVDLDDAAAELKVWGTCTGQCQVVQLVVQQSTGY